MGKGRWLPIGVTPVTPNTVRCTTKNGTVHTLCGRERPKGFGTGK